MSHLKSLLRSLALGGLLLVPATQANDALSVAYVHLNPPLVGNYDKGSSKLKFFKADIALRIQDDKKDLVKHHEPLIRDQLVMLFSQKSAEELGSLEGKERIRKDALLRIQQALQQEESHPLVDDLLFNNLVIQP